jgi:acetylornithine deacetylase/succinyl-diaminopimelate desuccinylase-like protein
MIECLRQITIRPFNGKKREGARHAYILKELRKRNCDATIDHHGNIWVEKGSGKKIVLFSSHIDVDQSIKKLVFRISEDKGRKIIEGVLDNSVGCYLNLLLAGYGPKKGRAIYVFTASEEAERNHPRRFAKSAREVVHALKKRGITPEFCVAIDVTYPRLIRAQEKIKWELEHTALFDMEDKTHCYLDGYKRRVARKMAMNMVDRFDNPLVKTRRLHGHDEAHIYSKLCPAFACGPVVQGHFDQPNQRMHFAHFLTALKFLKQIA